MKVVEAAGKGESLHVLTETFGVGPRYRTLLKKKRRFSASGKTTTGNTSLDIEHAVMTSTKLFVSVGAPMIDTTALAITTHVQKMSCKKRRKNDEDLCQ